MVATPFPVGYYIYFKSFVTDINRKLTVKAQRCKLSEIYA